MQLIGVILLCVILGAWLTGSVLRRIGVRWGGWLSLFAGMLVRLGASLVLAWTAVEAAQRGGVWFGAMAVGFGTAALAGFALLGLFAWGLVKYGTAGDD